MFEYSCLIRKNTPKLRDSLESLGYVRLGFLDRGREYLSTSCVYGTYCDLDDVYAFDSCIHRPYDFIDCGEDEEMFLAIAAIRNDSDYMQWFVCGEDGDSMFQVDKPMMSAEKYVHEYMDCWDTDGYRKADAVDLIRYFSKKREKDDHRTVTE